jgi:hypothetical protein
MSPFVTGDALSVPVKYVSFNVANSLTELRKLAITKMVEINQTA